VLCLFLLIFGYVPNVTKDELDPAKNRTICVSYVFENQISLVIARIHPMG